ncbi:MAG: hypothetical protein GKR93_01730 [Gammaproteobacteria bacterium]|nr:hypothetical protein [Gammaproteobacteria bacterium]
MSIEEFRNLAQGIQAIAICLGVIIGGGWALYQFTVLRSVNRAKAELEKLSNDLKSSRSVKVNLSPRLLGDPDEGEAFIAVEVVVTNDGSLIEHIDWKERVATQTRIDSSIEKEKENSKNIIYGIEKSNIYKVIDFILYPKESLNAEILFPLDSHGLFLIEVYIDRDVRAQDDVRLEFEAIGKSLGENGKLMSYGTKYIDTRKMNYV